MALTYGVLDVETTTNVFKKRKASPFSPDNWVVASGWKLAGKPAQGLYHGRNRNADRQWFVDLLKQSRMVVGHNIKFDLLHILRDPVAYRAWQE